MLLFIKLTILIFRSLVRVSIHLMLLFIYAVKYNTPVVITFQYISCCYLSNIENYGALVPIGFNTSHVVIYPTVLKHFFFSLFPFIPYFKAFSEILPAFFHFYIFLFIIVQPLVFTGFFRYFQFFQLVKFLQTNTYTLHLQFILSV